jgi:hypothetical protein
MKRTKYNARKVTADGVTKPKATKIWVRTDTWQPISRDDAIALRKASGKSAAACFDSGQEFRRWHELKMLERAGKIQRLERQVAIPCFVEGELMWTLKPDFAFFQDGKRIYDDTKGRKKGFEYRQFKDRWKVAKAVHRNAEWRVNGVKWEGR